jgi:hypothetical protein
MVQKHVEDRFDFAEGPSAVQKAKRASLERARWIIGALGKVL